MGNCTRMSGYVDSIALLERATTEAKRPIVQQFDWIILARVCSLQIITDKRGSISVGRSATKSL